jgi:pimeloyl-ACP methyl ester carboxylesterase
MSAETGIGKLETIRSADGTAIGFRAVGDGPPLLLVHGAAADHRRWAPIVEPLSRRFRVLLMDRRGRGHSGDADDYAIEREYEDVDAVIAHVGGAAVLGHSYGGVCALEAAARGAPITKLVIYEAPVGYLQSPPEVVAELQSLLERDERDLLLQTFMREVAGLSREQIEAMRAMPAWAARLEVAGTIPREERENREYSFAPERFAGVTTPTLILQGGDSSDAFKAGCAAIAGALPDARLVLLPGQRHNAMDMDPEMFVAEVLDFL